VRINNTPQNGLNRRQNQTNYLEPVEGGGYNKKTPSVGVQRERFTAKFIKTKLNICFRSMKSLI
jgi:hypothetical protein